VERLGILCGGALIEQDSQGRQRYSREGRDAMMGIK